MRSREHGWLKLRRRTGWPRPGAILIFHNGFDARGGVRDQTVAAIGPLIDTMRERGYRFATIDEVLGVPPYLN